jgi:HlyD family secretion protein
VDFLFIQQNVVTYNVVVTVANEDGALLPGMTANVRFAVNQKDSVLRAPNAALRYKPSDADTDGAPTRQPSKSVLYRLEGGKPVPVNVKTGIADGAFTEITEGGIKEGDKLVVREAANKDKSGSNFKLRMF